MIGKINGITNYNYMMPGKVLWLPTKTATTSSRIILSSRTRSSPGETPAALCQSYGIDYNANYKLLAALNNNLNVFMAGQQFILPLYVTPAGAATPTPAPTSGTSAAPTATPKPGTTPAPTANVPTGDTVSYYLAQHTLQYGETVSGVCAALGVDFSSNDATIRKINNITNYNYMMPGKVILIPTKTVPDSGSYYKIMAHKIVSGDTLYALCASYGLDYYAYSKLISLLNPNAAYYNLLPRQYPLYAAVCCRLYNGEARRNARAGRLCRYDGRPGCDACSERVCRHNGFRCAERHSRRFRQAHYDAQHPRRGYAQLSHHPAQDSGRRHRHEYLR